MLNQSIVNGMIGEFHGKCPMFEKIKQEDKEVRDTFIKENTGLVWSVVKRFTNRGYDQEELFQIGCIGLIKAVDRFDEKYEVAFSTYAVPLITGELKRFFS